MKVYGEDLKLLTSRHWHKVGNGKAFNLNLYESKQSGYKVWFADFRDKRDDGNIITSRYYKIGLADDLDMQQAFRIANKIALAGESGYPE